MEGFKWKKNDGWYDFYATEILPSGQTIKIEFQENESSKVTYFSIYLCIMNKRKCEEQSVLHITGKDGLMGLLWAKEKIKEFESYVQSYTYAKERIVIYCGWDDNRRRNIYYRGLKSLGYYYGRVFGEKVIMKELFHGHDGYESVHDDIIERSNI